MLFPSIPLYIDQNIKAGSFSIIMTKLRKTVEHQYEILIFRFDLNATSFFWVMPGEKPAGLYVASPRPEKESGLWAFHCNPSRRSAVSCELSAVRCQPSAGRL